MSRNSVAAFITINVRFALVRMRSYLKKEKAKKKATELVSSQEAKGSVNNVHSQCDGELLKYNKVPFYPSANI